MKCKSPPSSSGVGGFDGDVVAFASDAKRRLAQTLVRDADACAVFFDAKPPSTDFERATLLQRFDAALAVDASVSTRGSD